jgi:hypothetical protein
LDQEVIKVFWYSVCGQPPPSPLLAKEGWLIIYKIKRVDNVLNAPVVGKEK